MFDFRGQMAFHRKREVMRVGKVGVGLRVWGLDFRGKGLGIGVYGLGFRVWDLGFRV